MSSLRMAAVFSTMSMACLLTGCGAPTLEQSKAQSLLEQIDETRVLVSNYNGKNKEEAVKLLGYAENCYTVWEKTHNIWKDESLGWFTPPPGVIKNGRYLDQGFEHISKVRKLLEK